MFTRPLRLLAAATALALVPVGATAQQFSESHQFLEAVRKADGSKVMEILNKPGQTIINTKDRTSGEGALHIVAKKGDATYLRFLIQKGANPNLSDGRGNTPMILAVMSGFDEGVDILITYKANINLGNSSGETPLILAVQRGKYDLARRLLDAGADPDKADIIAGMSARDYAKQSRSPAVVKLLAEAPKAKAAAAMGPKL